MSEPCPGPLVWFDVDAYTDRRARGGAGMRCLRLGCDDRQPHRRTTPWHPRDARRDRNVSTLHDRLTAAITARLDVARAAAENCGCHPPSPQWHFGDDEDDGRIIVVDNPHPDVRLQLSRRWNRCYSDMHMARHIASWDPTTAIRVLEALREVVERHAPYDPNPDLCDMCGAADGDVPWPCPDVLSVARALGVEVE